MVLSNILNLFDKYLGSLPTGTWETANTFELVRYVGGVVLICAVVFALMYFMIMFFKFIFKR